MRWCGVSSPPALGPFPWTKTKRTKGGDGKEHKQAKEEEVPLSQVHMRLLARAVDSPRSLPPLDNSAMDGFAVRSADTTGPPVELVVVGTLPAGVPPEVRVGPGEAVRIMTGGPVPEGADAVLVAEHAEEEEEKIRVLQPVPPGKHIGMVDANSRVWASDHRGVVTEIGSA